MARVDMHCHSIYSDQPIHWVFRKLGARESYTPVESLYRRLKKVGMDFVTITDHNRIEGAQKLADKYPDCFVSCEFSVCFHNEPAVIHLCAYDISEEQFSMGLKLRGDIQEFAAYFREQNVLVSVPHPFHCNRSDLTIDHLEQVLLLFDYFEEVNGLQMEMANRMQEEFFASLSPEFFERLQKKHGFAPSSEHPWDKGLLGGSDDHSSFFLGRCWTEVDGAANYKEFLEGVRKKRSRGRGQSMTALAFSQATQSSWIHTILDHYCKPGTFDERLVRLVSKMRPESKIRKAINDLASSRISVDRPSFIKKLFFKKLIRFRLLFSLFAQKRFLDRQLQDDCECLAMDVPVGSVIELESFKATMKELLADWRNTELLFNRNPDRNLQDETFDFISTIFNTLYRYSFRQWLHHIQTGNIPEAFAKLSLIIPGILPAVPYIMGYKHFFSDKNYLREIGERYKLKNSPAGQTEKWGWFTDTLMDANGTAQVVREYVKLAEEISVSLTAIVSYPQDPDFDGDFVNFKPLFCFPLPEYETKILTVPSILDVVHHCEQQGYTRLILSSPGPVALLGLWAGHLLSIPVSGVYHTDIPGYVNRLTNDTSMTGWAWRLISFFYGKMERVYTLSNSSRQELIDKGVDKDKIHYFVNGVDLDFYTPEKKGEKIMSELGVSAKVVLLYVGQVSREMGLDLLGKSYRSIRSSIDNVALVVVGDGPYLEEFKEEMADVDDVVCTGFIEAGTLARIYGGSDIFVSPSTNDAYRPVLLEAQASGLPSVVSDAGGLKEVVVDGQTGFITESKNHTSLTKALLKLIDNRQLRQDMGKKSRALVEGKSWQNGFESFCNDHGVML